MSEWYLLKWIGRRIKWVINKLPYITMILLIALGFYLQFVYFVTPNPILGFFLFAASVFSVAFVFPLWRKFTPVFAPWVIEFVTQSFLGKKLISGGNLIYSEYVESREKIGLFAPIGRFINIGIAFLGVTTTLVKLAIQVKPEIRPESPIREMASTIGWSVILFVVPVILTPIIPVVWAMEDLQLKSWHKGKKINWRVSDKYRARFNSFITIGAVTAGLSLSSDPNLSFLDNLLIFLTLLANGMILLTMPLGMLVTAYYFYFRGEITGKTLERLDIPVAMTELIFDVEKYKSMEKRLEQYEKEEEKRRKEEEKRKKREERAKKIQEKKSKIKGILRLPFSSKNEKLESPVDRSTDESLEIQSEELNDENEYSEKREQIDMGVSSSEKLSSDNTTPSPDIKNLTDERNEMAQEDNGKSVVKRPEPVQKENKIVSTLKTPPRLAKNILGSVGNTSRKSIKKIGSFLPKKGKASKKENDANE